jgi:hypothetical protein
LVLIVGLVFSIHDPTEVAIQKMIDASQRMLKVSSKETLGGISPPQKRHLELEIKTLQNAPRDSDKLRELLKIKRRQYEKATLADEIQPLITEIEMLKFVLFLVCRNIKKEEHD